MKRSLRDRIFALADAGVSGNAIAGALAAEGHRDGVSRTSIQRLLKDRRPPTFAELVRACDDAESWEALTSAELALAAHCQPEIREALARGEQPFDAVLAFVSIAIGALRLELGRLVLDLYEDQHADALEALAVAAKYVRTAKRKAGAP